MYDSVYSWQQYGEREQCHFLIQKPTILDADCPSAKIYENVQQTTSLPILRIPKIQEI